MRAPEVVPGGGAFVSEYRGPAANRGARIYVQGPNGERRMVPYDYAKRQGEEQHRAAVESCIFDWGPRLVSASPARYLVGGEVPGSDGKRWAWLVVEP